MTLGTQDCYRYIIGVSNIETCHFVCLICKELNAELISSFRRKVRKWNFYCSNWFSVTAKHMFFPAAAVLRDMYTACVCANVCMNILCTCTSENDRS